MAELARPHPMQRLLQGEVGSGKTLVALRAMLAVVDAGGQAALLAPDRGAGRPALPDGHLAAGRPGRRRACSARREHATGVVLITGSQSARPRGGRRRLRAASGEAGIVIGTHALLSAGVQFADLGLVVVDEQHRFGVEQRAALERQGRRPAARAGDDRDPDPAVGRHDGVRRPGDLDAAGDPGRPGRGEHRGRGRRASAGVGAAGLAADRRGGRPGPAGVRGVRPDLRPATPTGRRPDDRRRPPRWRICTPS